MRDLAVEPRLVVMEFSATSHSLDGNAYVVEVEGELDLATVGDLQDALDAPLRDDSSRVIVDLEGCGFIDSTGIRTLVSVHSALGGRDGNDRALAIVSGENEVRRVLGITGIDALIPIFGDREAALSFVSSSSSS
jgi:anti-sigma B factor antagonist